MQREKDTQRQISQQTHWQKDAWTKRKTKTQTKKQTHKDVKCNYIS